MISATLFILGIALLVVGQAIALAIGTDRQQPMSYYIRKIFATRYIGFPIAIIIYLWLGWHFLIDRTGGLPF
jgi:hypothetical protein